MALNNIEGTIILDVYDHDTTPTKIKAIALDSKTRYVLASLRNNGNVYDAGQNTTVTLTIIRPDNTGVQITGETKQIVDLAPEGEVTVYGVYAELTQTALAVKGTLRAQFMLTSGEQVLRTEIFAINCGEALDASTDTWAGEYQGYNLDELVQNVNTAVGKVDAMEQDVSELKSGLNDLTFRGTITANTDINTLENGQWRKDGSTAVVNGVTGDSATHGAKVIVFKKAASGYNIIQIWADTIDGSVYTRTQNSTSYGFTAWTKLTNQSDVDQITQAINSLNANAFLVKTGLTDAQDLNALTEQGQYRKDSAVTVTNGVTGVSAGHGARLLVFKGTSAYNIFQMWIDTIDGSVYTRAQNSATYEFTPWELVVNETYIKNNSFTFGGSLVAEQDLNGLTGAAHWRKDSDVQVVNGVEGESANHGAKVIVFRNNDNQYNIVQMWFDTLDGSVYFRTQNSNYYGFTAWERLVTQSEIEAHEADEFYFRGSLENDQDMNTLASPGQYRKDSNIRVTNGVETASANSGAKVLVFKSRATSSYNIVQMWIDTISGTIYSRTSNSASYGFTPWKELSKDDFVQGKYLDFDFGDGTYGYYDATEIFAKWDALATKYSQFVTKRILGQASGYDYPVYTINCSPYYLSNAYRRTDDVSNIYAKPRALVVASMHGDETAPAMEVFQAFKLMLEGERADILNAFIWDVVPVGNPWGVSHIVLDSNGDVYYKTLAFAGGSVHMPTGYSVVTRESVEWRGGGIRFQGDGIDMNRDFCDSLQTATYTDMYGETGNTYDVTLGFQAAETRYIRQLGYENKYDLVVDFHIGSINGSTLNPDPFVSSIGMGGKSSDETQEQYAAYKNKMCRFVDDANHKTMADAANHYNVNVNAQSFMFFETGLDPNVGTLIGWSRGNNARTADRTNLCKSTWIIEQLSRAPYYGGAARNSITVYDLGVNHLLNILDALKTPSVLID